jgi:hypothetical protein
VVAIALELLSNNEIDISIKPAILSLFGDICV